MMLKTITLAKMHFFLPFRIVMLYYSRCYTTIVQIHSLQSKGTDKRIRNGYDYIKVKLDIQSHIMTLIIDLKTKENRRWVNIIVA
jgi:hypothetical protein